MSTRAAANLRKPVITVMITVAGLATVSAALEHHADATQVSKAAAIAAPAAQGLGFDLRQFDGPSVSGSRFRDTQSFEWRRTGRQGEVEHLQLLPSEGLLCWSTLRRGEFHSHGCVAAPG